MKCSVDLYINDNKVDIINSEEFAQQFALTYSFSDLYEPDKVTDTYSKSITLPGTPNNNNIFANIWKLDSDNIDKFNPSQESTFYITLNNEKWQTGTAQLQEITRKDNVYSYKVVLYGQITKVMSLLLNSDIEDENNKLLRSLKFPDGLKHNLNPNVLSMLWNGSYYTGHIYLNDYMNYVPANNGLYDNFNSSRKLTIDSSSNLVIRPYVYTEYANRTVSSEDTEFDEYITREYRVEYQRPAIKMNKLIEQIVSDCAADASINLDSEFFHSSNPYWNNTYLTLSQYTTESDEGEIKGTTTEVFTRVLENDESTTFTMPYVQSDGNITIFSPDDASTAVYFGNIKGQKRITLEFEIKVSVLSSIQLNANHTFANGYWDGTLNNPSVYFTYGSNWERNKWEIIVRGTSGAYSDRGTGDVHSYWTQLNEGFYPFIRLSLTGSPYYNWFNYNYVYNNNYPDTPYQYDAANRELLSFPQYSPINDENRVWKPYRYTINVSDLTDEGVITIKVDDIDNRFIYLDTSGVVYPVSNHEFPVMIQLRPITKAPEGTPESQYGRYFPYLYGFKGIDALVSYNTNIRSGDNYDGTYSGTVGSEVTVTDMFDTTTTQGEILMNYTKLLGLLYDTDKDGNITIMSKNKYFSNYKILDWSNKVDYSREFSIKPLTFNSRYLDMKYKSGDSYYENKYSSQFGLQYGEKKINTGYAFNSQPVSLLDTIFTNTVMSSDIRREYSSTSSGYIKGTTIDSLSLPAYYSKDGETKNSIDGKYNLLFRNGDQNTTTSYITCDSSIMMDETLDDGGSYCWYDHAMRTYGNFWACMYSVSNIPFYTTHYNDYSWDIGYPRISYDGSNTSSYSSTSTVYSRFWEEYISEIYNVKNRILTCYVKLSWIDILNFSFKNFVKINGVLYHPNKLLNVNPLSDDPVQVELIQVQNIKGYASQYFPAAEL